MDLESLSKQELFELGQIFLNSTNTAILIGVKYNSPEIETLKRDIGEKTARANDPRFKVWDVHHDKVLEGLKNIFKDKLINGESYFSKYGSETYDVVLGVPKRLLGIALEGLQERFIKYTFIVTINPREKPI